MAEKKQEPLDKLLAKIAKKPEEIVEFQQNLPVLSFGVFGLDMMLACIDPTHGNGGSRARDGIEIMAMNGAGKTAIMYSSMAATMRRFPGDDVIIVAYCSEPPDEEQFIRMRKMGVDPDRVAWIGLECSGNRALEQLLTLVKYDKIKDAFVDSIAAIPVEANEGKTLEDADAVAALAKLYNPFFKRFVKETKYARLVQCNHYREPVSTGRPGQTTAPNVLDPNTVGGKTKDFLGKARIILKTLPKWEKDNKNSHTGKNMINEVRISAKLVRNKYAPPLREVEFTYNLDDFTFNNEEVTIAYATAFSEKVGDKWKSLLSIPVTQAGSYYSIGDFRCQGIEKAINYLKENQDIMYQLQKEILPHSKRFFSDTIEFDPDEMDKD